MLVDHYHEQELPTEDSFRRQLLAHIATQHVDELRDYVEGRGNIFAPVDNAMAEYHANWQAYWQRRIDILIKILKTHKDPTVYADLLQCLINKEREKE